MSASCHTEAGILRLTIVAAAAALVFASFAPAAGAQETSKPVQTSAETCFPQCRPGFLCHGGHCVSACNPPCADSEMCTPDAQCVSRCNPACAANEMCTSTGACVSRCNPPCGAGQQCTPAGACAGGLTNAAAGGVRADPGWARKAGKLGIITSAALAGLTVGVFIADAKDSNSLGLAMGIPATLLGGIAIPIIAAGGRSARKGGHVDGSPGLRVVGWVLYGVSLADAVALIGLTINDSAPNGVGGSVGLLGTASALAFTSDAYTSAGQAEAVMVGPSVGVARDRTGKLTTTFGVRISF